MITGELWLIYALAFGATLLGVQALYWVLYEERRDQKNWLYLRLDWPRIDLRQGRRSVDRQSLYFHRIAAIHRMHSRGYPAGAMHGHGDPNRAVQLDDARNAGRLDDRCRH